ncbi:DISARM system helicase DrmA [Polyangium sorediatum]|uniref:DISARM system helicase DrmA n=1 Tax=Polyangium sorediatum TaxID=889274 RepID=A0ABT6P915_9BACT|nr:DISARM system helicase DrmA [Polyangium sorediatum]MDI1437119.1 DISARM system helicase DrmA [Polyangium sorediatum]
MPPVTAPRDHLVRALSADLVGPYQLDEEAIVEHEILELPPSRHYLTGFLASEEERAPEDPTADDSLGAGPDEPEEENQGGGEEPEDKRPNLWPASIGMSVLVPRETHAVKAVVRFAEYYPDTVKPEGRGRGKRIWKRKPRQTISADVPLDAQVLAKGIRLQDTVGLVLYGQVRAVEHARGLPEGTRALALFVVNQRGAGERGRRDEQMVFQVEMEIECAEGIVPRPNFSDEESDQWDQKVADLQFRERVEYAVGHGVAVEVPPGQSAIDNGGSPGKPGSAPKPPVTRVKTTWLPEYEVRRVVAHEEAGVTVAMEELAKLQNEADVRARLERLPAAYGEWIQRQRAADVGGEKRAETRDALMQKAEDARRRIQEGIELLAKDGQVRQAFCLANEAMAEAARHRSPSRYQGGKRPEWRLFQLAFLLMNLQGVATGEHADRERVELIFFPTGGGKTEAYLGVIAYCLLLRRLRRAKLPDGGLGVTVLLRYTLRLLTLDQLGRAATLICALESQRRKMPAVLGDTRFSVGLWVGRSATANTMEEASKLVTGFKIGVNGNPCPLPTCPWCGEELGPNSLTLLPTKTAPDEVRVGCTSETCEFSCSNNSEGIPVVFVDEQVYRELPSFLIATVDKFAMMPWRGEAGMLFGKVSAREGRRFYGPMDGKPPRTAKNLPGGLAPPELIVQDELHLISGPLGTMVGLYETAVDTLCSRPTKNGVVRPKVLAATATVRRAGAQIQALFGRRADTVSVFPPPGIDDSETFFATVDTQSPGRKYVGVAAQGRSMKAILLRVYRTLLAGAMKTYDPSLSPDQTADGYMTLAGYFNSLRELGGMRRLVEDEVLGRAKQAEEARPLNAKGKHLWLANRDIGLEPVELTSREHTDAVKRTKDRLNKSWRDPEAINVLLASNMISVGVDIDRLGLMVVAGQPKTTAEYIQASSRVGRQEKWPGLVVTVYNLHKSRDRSHYEHFTAYHESFYRFVEATSVTPFSGPALDRGLVGTLVAMARFASPEMTPPKGAMALPVNRHQANAVIDQIAARASSQPELYQDGQEKIAEEIRKRGQNLLDTWTDLVHSTPEEPKQRRYSKYDREKVGGKPLLYTPLDQERPSPDTPDGRFAAPTSLRDVESTAHLWLVGRRLGRQG